ncbi:MAG: O-methyltransferase [Muribaculum sp.]|nr:O-methyltransferase [Muribaculum sp.]
MTEKLENYILSHIDPEPELLRKVNRDTHVMCLYSNMCSGHLQGRMLKMISRMIRPHKILELGTFTGYSALCLAEGMPDGAQLHTIEINDELADFIRERFDASPYADRIHLHIGDATQIIPNIAEQWDLVFIDANKRTYKEYYDLVFPKVRPGGFIIADNTLWYGKVSDSTCHDAQTAGILTFNEYVSKDPRVEKVILPLRDGLTIIYKKPELAQSAPYE